MMILSDHDRILYKFQNFAGNIYLPSMIFWYIKSLFKIVLGRTFLIVNRFSKILQHMFGHTKRRNLKRKYFAYS